MTIMPRASESIYKSTTHYGSIVGKSYDAQVWSFLSSFGSVRVSECSGVKEPQSW